MQVQQLLKFLFGAVLLCSMGFTLAQKIELVSGNDYAPYAGSKLPEGGLATALVKKAFAQTGVDTNLTWLPWAQGYADTKQGKFDATFPHEKTPTRSQDMIFSEPVISVQERVYVKAGPQKFDFAGVNGFAGSTICLASGALPHPKLAALLEGGKLKRVAPMNVSICIALVDSGLADFFVLEERLAKAALAVSGLAAGAVVVADMAPLSVRELHLMAPRHKESSDDLIAKFNRGLLQIRENGDYEQVLKALSK
jgi:polar amino acid transport system substrate-binding protein